MRKIKYLMVFMLFMSTVFTYSCSNEQGERREKVYKKVLQLPIDDKDLDNPIIGYISEGNKAVLTKNSELLLSNWNRNLLIQSKIDAKLDAVGLIELEQDYYLRATSSSTGYTSTVGAFVDKGYVYATTTSCASSGCSGSQCLPKGTDCSSCFYTCTRTVTSTSTLYLQASLIEVRVDRYLLADYYIRKGWTDQIYWEYKK